MESRPPPPKRKIRSMQFGILSPKEVAKMSVVKVSKPVTVERGVPQPNGLSDVRMGTTNRDFPCGTCSGDHHECPGHFGHIELEQPVFHTGFLRVVLQVLRSVCRNCSRLRVGRDDARFHDAQRIAKPSKRLREMSRLGASMSHCKSADMGTEMGEDGAVRISGGACGNEQPRYRRVGLRIRMEYKGQAGERYITPQEVHAVFEKIAEEDVVALGLSPEHSHPAWMVISNLPVPPPQVRPSIQMDSTSEAQDDLTYQLTSIVKANIDLRTATEQSATASIIAERLALLQFHVATYFNNEEAGIDKAQHKSGKMIKSIRQRLKSKEGRIRGNMMGKRVNFSARSVITPDPNLSINQVGVPRSIALNLTYPERVTAYNLNKLHELVRRGPDQHPGAKHIIRPDGTRVSLREISGEASRDQFLDFGYIVERHIDDGDPILFNRQPSLHKMSIMGHYVKVMPYSTFRLNLTCTSPYNADFDGDEMNMHVPQSIETRAEIDYIMLSPRQIVSPQANKPVMGIVQDTLLGCDKFTRRDVFLERDMVMNLCMWIPNWDGVIPVPAILKPRPLWTGKQLMSTILPRINLTRTHGTHPDDERGDTQNHSPGDTFVRIEQGQLLTGMLCKKTLGSSAGSLIHVSWNERGHEETRNFIDACQKLVNYWLLHRGFSIGIADTIADRAVQGIIKQKITAAKAQVQEYVRKAQAKQLQPQPGMTYMQVFESKVNGALNGARDYVGKSSQDSLDVRTSNVKSMVTAGSKGSFLNISQMMGCVGQQNVEGKRIPYGFRRRTLPHFTKDDHGPESRGFVENSYLQGLTPQEFFFHAMGGREGLSDTAIKTADTGYIQRRLIKAMEDVMVKYDGTVRRATGDIVQFLYGEDGLDGTHVETQVFETLDMDNKRFRETFFLDVEAADFGEGYLADPAAVRLDPAARQLIDEEYRQLLDDREMLRTYISPSGDNKYPMPVNMSRLIWNAKKEFHIDESRPSNMSPSDVITMVNKLISDALVVVPGSDSLSREAQANATMMFSILIRSRLASKVVLREHHLTNEAFVWVLGYIRTRFVDAMAHPGEMVGAIAAQSIGEPATQMTLNTFHHAGISAKNVTLGVPRLKEIMAVPENVRTPSVQIFLEKDVCRDSELAKQVHAKIEHLTLADATLLTEIYYDPDPKMSILPEDEDMFHDYYVGMEEVDIANGSRCRMSDLSPWVLRLVLDKKKLFGKDISPEMVADLIEREMDGDVHVAYTQADAPKLVLRIRLVETAGEDDGGGKGRITDGDAVLLTIEGRLMNVIALRGIPGITKAFLEQEAPVVTMEDGSFVKGPQEWIIDTEGSALRDLLCIDGVDHRRILSNNVAEMLDVFGIECARACLLRFLRQVISHTPVNYRHLSVLCDIMTTRGHLMAISRHGTNRADTGTLLRASFEETVEILFDAAAFAERDPLKGVTPAIMLGQIANVGTGEFALLLDQEALQSAIPVRMQNPGAQEYGDYGSYDMTALAPGEGTPMQEGTPVYSPMGGQSPLASMQYSPGPGMDSGMARAASPGYSGGAPMSPSYSPGGSPASPSYSPTGNGGSPASPGYSPTGAQFSPSSPSYDPVGIGSNSPSSPNYSPSSPLYSPNSPSYSPRGAQGGSPASPNYSPSSPNYSPSSPNYSPSSPNYSPSSPNYSPSSPNYSPSSPNYSPSSPNYSPSSPNYSPSSPNYSPSSPNYSPSSPNYSPSSPNYSPSSPNYSPSSPNYSPSSPNYSPSSPNYSPSSPNYSPSSPNYSPSSPNYSPSSPNYSPSGGSGSPASPSYSPSGSQ